jgi:N-formylglutamate amidohydrolase
MDFKKYFDIGKGFTPVVLSCPHGGYKKPKILDDKDCGSTISDTNTFPIGKLIIEILKSKNIYPNYILSKIHRSKLDLNRPPFSNSAYSQDMDSNNYGRKIFKFYHDILQNYVQKCVYEHDRCLFIDLHGFSKPNDEYPDIILGTVFGQSMHVETVRNELENSNYWGHSNLVKKLSKYFEIDDGMGETDFNLSYSGGYITYQFLRKSKVNAIQIEIAKHIRTNRCKIKLLIDAISESVLESLNNFETIERIPHNRNVYSS